MSERRFVIKEAKYYPWVDLPPAETITESELKRRLQLIRVPVDLNLAIEVITKGFEAELHGEGENVPRVKRNDGKYAEYDPEQQHWEPCRMPRE